MMRKSKWQKNYEGIVNRATRTKWEDLFIHLVGIEGFPKPEKEYRFWPGRKWRVDFAYPNRKNPIAIEIEGGIWRKGGGAHSHPENIQRDIEKYNHLTLKGFRLLRFSPKELQSGQAMAMLAQVLGETNGEIFPEIA